MPFPLGKSIPKGVEIPIVRWATALQTTWSAMFCTHADATHHYGEKVVVCEKPACITQGGKSSPSGVKLFSIEVPLKARLQHDAHLVPNGKESRSYSAPNPTANTRSVRVGSFAPIVAWQRVNTHYGVLKKVHRQLEADWLFTGNNYWVMLMRPAPH